MLKSKEVIQIISKISLKKTNKKFTIILNLNLLKKITYSPAYREFKMFCQFSFHQVTAQVLSVTTQNKCSDEDMGRRAK